MAAMGGLLFLLFLLVPVAELIVIFKVGGQIGWLETLTLLVVISMLGAWLVRREGLSTLLRVQRGLSEGQMPTKSLVDGLLILVAGGLMLTPGFLTDIVGLLLLFPPTRVAVRSLLIRRYHGRLDAGFGAAAPSSSAFWNRVVIRDDVIDVDGYEQAQPREQPPPPRDGTTGEVGP